MAAASLLVVHSSVTSPRYPCSARINVASTGGQQGCHDSSRSVLRDDESCFQRHEHARQREEHVALVSDEIVQQGGDTVVQ